MLNLVATPIGSPDEISIKALECIKNADIVICESTKDTSKLLRVHGISGKKFELLNEHSKKEDVDILVDLCEEFNCVLMSDSGTPGFCDPGADLVRLCRKKNISIRSILGASCLMGVISLSGVRLDEFVFRGFLPAENESRRRALQELSKERRAIIIMDTPYRLIKTVSDMQEHMKDRNFLLALDLSCENELIIEGAIHKIKSKLEEEKREKAEFILLVYAKQ